MNYKVEQQIKNLSHSDWQSYAGLKGSSQARTRANSALLSAMKWGENKIESDDCIDPVKVGQKCFTRVAKVLDRLGEWGFQDTEPQCQLCYLIERFLDLPSYSVER